MTNTTTHADKMLEIMKANAQKKGAGKWALNSKEAKECAALHGLDDATLGAIETYLSDMHIATNGFLCEKLPETIEEARKKQAALQANLDNNRASMDPKEITKAENAIAAADPTRAQESIRTPFAGGSVKFVLKAQTTNRNPTTNEPIVNYGVFGSDLHMRPAVFDHAAIVETSDIIKRCFNA